MTADAGAQFGLCATCSHQRIVRNTRGSTFSLCRRSETEPDYPRYPRVPVLDCAGYEAATQGDDAGRVDGPR